ncbi:MAG: hypothetical protein A2Y78_03535 [Acidobacteria bacterium RBG_13_68_16]|jgi:hypothetical protein|nr:MAG: hypothetical protein A2Y78_03535 [Acidobacteria bacterium RBG_13_68_16]
MRQVLSINRLIVIFCTLGFLFLVVDTFLEHIEAFKDEPLAWIPVAFSVVGLAIAGIASARWNETWIRLLHWCFIAALAVGAAGVCLHVADQFESEEERVAEHGDDTEEHKLPPILPPLAFTGLGAFGLIATLRKWQAETKS